MNCRTEWPKHSTRASPRGCRLRIPQQIAAGGRKERSGVSAAKDPGLPARRSSRSGATADAAHPEPVGGAGVLRQALRRRPGALAADRDEALGSDDVASVDAPLLQHSPHRHLPRQRAGADQPQPGGGTEKAVGTARAKRPASSRNATPRSKICGSVKPAWRRTTRRFARRWPRPGWSSSRPPIRVRARKPGSARPSRHCPPRRSRPKGGRARTRRCAKSRSACRSISTSR